MREIVVLLQRSTIEFDLYRLKFSYIIRQYLARVVVLRHSVVAHFNVYYFDLFCVLFCQTCLVLIVCVV